MTNRTFAIIKPDAVKNNYSGKIIDHILKAGFKLLSARLTRMTIDQAERFYGIHKGKTFFEELTY
ncbi:MAG: nucleoside-diphosphate kinase, partial [Candidatus Marinimicrobia bacterium]|nr:nucleoside-diphosphate kinase [Candidatus Neomarinimicrobiota bacterium]